MRKVLMLFALLAAFKVWTQDRLVRSVMQDALVKAYRERATELCRKEALKPGRNLAHAVWPGAADAQITIGAPGLAVAIWDFDNPLWDVRFRHPHLVLTSQTDAKTRCAYDLSAGVASLSGS